MWLSIHATVSSKFQENRKRTSNLQNSHKCILLWKPTLNFPPQFLNPDPPNPNTIIIKGIWLLVSVLYSVNLEFAFIHFQWTTPSINITPSFKMSKLVPNHHLFEINYQREEAKSLTSLATKKKFFKLYSITVVHCFKKSSLGQKKEQSPHSPGAEDIEYILMVCSPQCPKGHQSLCWRAITFCNQPKRSHWFNQNQLWFIRGLLCEEYLFWKAWYCLRLFTFVVKFPYLFCCASVCDTEFQYYRSSYWISLQPLATWFPFLEAYWTYLFKHWGEKILIVLSILLCA